MSDRPLHVVDVFAEEKYAGNPLAVVRDAGALSDAEMQAIAREMNHSETTFVESPEPRDGGYDVRIFTPKNELEFAGHPTLGTAWVLREAVADDRPGTVRLNLGVGQIPVEVREDEGSEVLWMTQQPPTFGETLDPELAAEVLGVEAADVDDRFPVRAVSTGLPSLIVPLTSLDAVRRAGTVSEPYREHVVDGVGAENVLCFAPETVREGNDLHVRVFAELHGVPEDPATGSSNGCLAAYLARERYLDAPAVDVRVEQGYEMDRPSLLYLRAEDAAGDGNADGDDFAVRVGGGVVPVVRGTLL